MSVPLTLTDLGKLEGWKLEWARSPFFRRISYRLTYNQIRDGNVWGGAYFSGVATPIFPRGGANAPNFTGLLTYVHTELHTATKFCTVIEVDEGKISYRVDHVAGPKRNFCDTNADGRSVCGSLRSLLFAVKRCKRQRQERTPCKIFHA